MTVPSAQTAGIVYTGNGITLAFSYPFRIFTASDLHVYFNGVEQFLGFTISGINTSSGGTVTFTVPPASGVKVSLIRLLPVTQLVDYQAFDAFPAETHEQALDKLTLLAQQNYEGDFRSIHVPLSEPIFAANLQLPSIAARANKTMQFDSLGNVVG